MTRKHSCKAVYFSAIAVTTSLFLPFAVAQPPAVGNIAMAGGMDMKAMMKDNSEKMSAMPTTGNPDIDFAMMMRMHHQGAIEMAQAELKNGKDPQLRKMAQSIITAQKKEIAQFDQTLAERGHPVEKMSK